MTQADRIFLRDHVLSAEIGAFQSERGREQRLRFNLDVELRDPVTGAADEVDRILSYDVLVQAVDTAMAAQRYDLVETLAERIVAEVLAHPQAAAITVTVEKLDRGPGALGVSLRRDRASMPATGVQADWRLMLWNAGAPRPEGRVVVVPPETGLPLPPGGNRRRIHLLALDQSAWALAGALSLEVAATRTELEAAMHMTMPVVWAPARLAAEAEDGGTTPLELALWLGERLGAAGLDLALPPDADLPELHAGTRLPVARLATGTE